jgi:PIN domain nuclease of toxin-antitoxin system
VEVLDASAILALLLGEPGADDVAQAIARGAAVSTVNLSEVAEVLVRNGHEPEPVIDRLSEQVVVEPFIHADALAAAACSQRTRREGLSLGDRACLALAQRLDTSAVTTDRQWSLLEVGVRIRLVR